MIEKISSSKIDSYKWCQKKFELQFIKEIPMPFVSPGLTIGKKTHKFIELFWKTYKLDTETYIEDMKIHLRNGIRRLYEPDQNTNIIIQINYTNFINYQTLRIKNYIEKYDNDYQTIKKIFYPILNEKFGSIKIENLTFSYVIDSLFSQLDWNLLIDWKTDKECNENQFKEHIPQLCRYSKCLESIKKDCKKMGVYFTRESLFFSCDKVENYSLKKEVLDFYDEIQNSKFLKTKDTCKCCTSGYQCEYYPNICKGGFN